jgi:hypothetical protein
MDGPRIKDLKAYLDDVQRYGVDVEVCTFDEIERVTAAAPRRIMMIDRLERPAHFALSAKSVDKPRR